MWTPAFSHKATIPSELFVFSQAQGNGDLIQGVLLQDILQIVDGTYDLHTVVLAAPFPVVIQDPADIVAPLGIGPHPVHKALGRTGISNQKDVLLVIAPGPHGPSTIRIALRSAVISRTLIP